MILNKYLFGSRIYGTNNENSDYDYIFITDDLILDNYVDDNGYQYYHKDTFQSLIDNMDIRSLECLFLESKYKDEKYLFDLNIVDAKLRKSISTIVSNSYVKAKKKIIDSPDYNLDVGLKSFFHSFRILDFAIQIKTNGRIDDWSKYNYILFDIKDMSEKLHHNDLWLAINTKYKLLHNSLETEFRKICKKQ